MARSGSWRTSCVLGFAAFASSSSANAETAWREHWPKFRPAEVAFTAGLSLQVAAATFLYREPTRNWQGGVLFYDSIRNAIRLDARAGRIPAASVSDGIYYGLLAYPFVIDVPVSYAKGDHVLGTQLLAISLESYALAGAIALSAEKVGRARPMAAECDRDPSYDRKCGNEGNLAAGFLSGHTTIAFTGASLLCAQHLHTPIYGGGAADVATCIGVVAAATGAGVLRVMSDNHYPSDILLGAGIGFVSGYLVPVWLHFGGGPVGTAGSARSFLPMLEGRHFSAVVAPRVAGDHVGAALSGAF